MTQGKGIRARWRSSGLDRLFRGPDSTSGTTIAEFAVGLPILFGLIFGVMELGRFGFTHAALYYAAQETTRWAVVNPINDEGAETQAEYEARLTAAAQSKLILISAGNVASVTADAPASAAGDNTRDINITLTYRYEWMLPYVGTGPIDLTVASKAFLAEEDGRGLLTSEACQAAGLNCGCQMQDSKGNCIDP